MEEVGGGEASSGLDLQGYLYLKCKKSNLIYLSYFLKDISVSRGL